MKNLKNKIRKHFKNKARQRQWEKTAALLGGTDPGPTRQQPSAKERREALLRAGI